MMVGILLFVYFCIVFVGAQIKVEVNMPFCTTNRLARPINLNIICSKVSKKNPNDTYILAGLQKLYKKYYRVDNIGNINVQYSVLSKKQRLIYGKGFHYVKTRLMWKYTMTFFRDRIEFPPIEENIQLTSSECWDMVETKACRSDNNIFNMSCDDSNCFVEEKPIVQFS